MPVEAGQCLERRRVGHTLGVEHDDVRIGTDLEASLPAHTRDGLLEEPRWLERHAADAFGQIEHPELPDQPTQRPREGPRTARMRPPLQGYRPVAVAGDPAGR